MFNLFKIINISRIKQQQKKKEKKPKGKSQIIFYKIRIHVMPFNK